MTTEGYERAVVRIRNRTQPGGPIVGLGMLVGPCEAVTCAHVVNAALGRDMREQGKPAESEQVHLEFCQISGDPGRMAKIVAWSPPPILGATGGDVAGLLLTDEAPAAARPAQFATVAPKPNKILRAFGYPGDPPRENGMWVDLDFKGVVSGQALQVESSGDQTVKAQPGYSGTAAFDPDTGRAVGLVQSAPLPDEPERDAYLLGPLAIAEVWEEKFDYLLIPPNPYRGLEPFRSADAAVFFGRDTEIEQLSVRLRKQPVVIVVGPSGVGKSSLVQGGLLPALALTEAWSVAVVRPGLDPWLRLAAALLKAERGGAANCTADAIQRRVDSLRSDGLGPTMQAFRAQDRPLILVIDQLEELLSGVASPDRELLDLLIPDPEAADDAGRIVLTLRANFQPILQTIPGFHSRLNERLYLLSPLTAAQMRRVVELPATSRGVKFEPGLVDWIVQEAAGGPQSPLGAEFRGLTADGRLQQHAIGQVAGGSLPLLEFTLTQLWNRQQHKTITFSGYQQMGGVRGALNRFADQEVSKLSDTATDVLDRVLLQLVSTSDAGALFVTRRRVFESEISDPEWAILCRLADARLVITDTRPADGGTYAELAHEALIVAWGRLRKVITENEDFLRWLSGIQARVAHGDPLPESRIAESRFWIESRHESIPQPVRDFIAASETYVEARLREMADAREDAIRRWVEMNSALAFLIQSVASGQPAETIVNLVVLTAAELIGPPGGTRASYFELEAGPPLELVSTPHRAGRRVPPGVFAGADHSDELISMVEHKQVKFVDNMDVGQGDGLGQGGSDYKTFISAPVVAGSTAYGVLTVDAPRPGDLEHRDVDLLSAMAGLVAIAFKNSRRV